MLAIITHTQFRKDLKQAKKREMKLEKLAHIVTELQHGKQLPPKTKIIRYKVIIVIVGNVILSPIRQTQAKLHKKHEALSFEFCLEHMQQVISTSQIPAYSHKETKLKEEIY